MYLLKLFLFFFFFAASSSMASEAATSSIIPDWQFFDLGTCIGCGGHALGDFDSNGYPELFLETKYGFHGFFPLTKKNWPNSKYRVGQKSRHICYTAN